jgi:hypothetical protein
VCGSNEAYALLLSVFRNKQWYLCSKHSFSAERLTREHRRNETEKAHLPEFDNRILEISHSWIEEDSPRNQGEEGLVSPAEVVSKEVMCCENIGGARDRHRYDDLIVMSSIFVDLIVDPRRSWGIFDFLQWLKLHQPDSFQ